MSLVEMPGETSDSDKRRGARRILERLLHEVIHSDRVPAGLALGVFFGFVAPPGVQTAVAVAAAALLRMSPLGAAVGVWVTNPLTIPLVYSYSLRMGTFLTGLDTPKLIPTEDERFWAFITNFRSHGKTIILLWTGLLFNGAVASLITLYGSRALAMVYRAVRTPATEHEANPAQLPSDRAPGD